MSDRWLTPMDAIFLYGETREVMMHVASLLIFTPPKDARPDFLRSLLDELRGSREIYPPWNLRLRTPEFLANPLHSWVEEPDIDIDYHVRRSALPAPGDERELGTLVSRLHSHAMDFHHPLWEVHLIEGLEGGRFAMYFKVHHSLVDGFTGSRILARSLSNDAGDRTRPMFFSIPPPEGAGSPADSGDDAIAAFRAGFQKQLESARQVGRELRDIVTGHKPHGVTPYEAPMSILNGRVSRNRRFATQQYQLERVKTLARRAGCTLNDLVLALSSTSLRRFLMELGALPADPLIAMIPVNVRPKDDPGGGNAVGSILASLATHIADPVERLKVIRESVCRAKEQLHGMSREAIIQFSALQMLPFAFQHVTGMSGRMRPPFNVVISNVAGPKETLYFRGARLDACYPVSIPTHGQAINITCQSYAGTLNFGFTGCRDTLPRMQRVAVYTGEALNELEQAVG